VQDLKDDYGVEESISQILWDPGTARAYKFRKALLMTNISYYQRMRVNLSRSASQTVKCQVATATQQPHIILYHEKVEMYSGPFGPRNMDSDSRRNHSGV
jgi:hypothetical protein